MSKEDQNYEREKYWSFTAAKTDINSVSDNLKIIIDAIDKKKSYSEIQDEITIFNKFSKESARKMINQCVKLGFIEPGINDSERNKYHPNCKKFIEEKDKTTKRIYFSNIFLEHNKLKSSFDENNDYGKVNKIKFLLNTIDQIGKLNEDQQYALMLCNPDDNIKCPSIRALVFFRFYKCPGGTLSFFQMTHRVFLLFNFKGKKKEESGSLAHFT